jgi:hypothetical protein
MNAFLEMIMIDSIRLIYITMNMNLIIDDLQGDTHKQYLKKQWSLDRFFRHSFVVQEPAQF